MSPNLILARLRLGKPEEDSLYLKKLKWQMKYASYLGLWGVRFPLQVLKWNFTEGIRLLRQFECTNLQLYIETALDVESYNLLAAVHQSLDHKVALGIHAIMPLDLPEQVIFGDEN
jgi:hypothetical protein